MYIKKIISAFLCVQLFTCSAFAAEASKPQGEYNLQELTLPSEVKDMNKNSGSIYYSTSVKNKVLIPVHIWGEVKLSGLHFIPSDTTLVKGLSLAGGPNSNAKLDDVIVIRNTDKTGSKEVTFDLSKGGDQNAHQYKLEPGDEVFVKKDTFYENRAYYTGLISIAVTVISTFFIINKVK